jgi:rhodanese-related sulfurtransferase
MKHLAFASLLAVAVPSFTWACDGEDKKASIQKVTVDQLASLLSSKMVSPVDANGAKTRETWGSIPGAILLTSSSQYDVSKELPADKSQKLVFYCANTRCGAAEGAAKRALEAGYQDVNVLPVGIAGWKEAGQKTASTAKKS